MMTFVGDVEKTTWVPKVGDWFLYRDDDDLPWDKPRLRVRLPEEMPEMVDGVGGIMNQECKIYTWRFDLGHYTPWYGTITVEAG